MQRADIDWDKITRAQAKRLSNKAYRLAGKLAAAYDVSGTDEDEATWWEMERLAEDLLVFALTGELDTL